jgi:hypothetical protein
MKSSARGGTRIILVDKFHNTMQELHRSLDCFWLLLAVLLLWSQSLFGCERTAAGPGNFNVVRSFGRSSSLALTSIGWRRCLRSPLNIRNVTEFSIGAHQVFWVEMCSFQQAVEELFFMPAITPSK